MIYSFYRRDGADRVHLIENQTCKDDTEAIARGYELCKASDIEVRLYGRSVRRIKKGSKQPATLT